MLKIAGRSLPPQSLLLVTYTSRSHSCCTMSSPTPSPSSSLPTKTHSNLFWSDPAQYRATSVPRLAVLLLNAPHSSWHIKKQVTAHAPEIHTTELFWTLWSNAHVTMCADGGANRLYDRSVKVEAEELVVPQYIKGDLDSLRSDVRAFYSARGTEIICDPDQNSNDLDKCLELIWELQEREPALGQFAVMIFGAMGGRFDQEMQNINALFRWHDRFAQIALLSEDTTARLLLPGFHHVIEPNFHFEARTCGLIPVNGPCTSTTTTGLKWNLTDQWMGFGGLISSSNHVDDRHTVVHVENSAPLIWTTELKK